MRAIVRRGTNLVLSDINDVTPGSGQVLVKTLTCGICGSDLHAVHHLGHITEMARRAGGGGTVDPSQDVVFGHEFCAEILDFGPGCTQRIKAGSRVVSMPFVNGPDGSEIVGYSNRFPGGFAERMLLQEALLIEVPNGLDEARAALTEPMAVGEHAVARAPITVETVALVIGCGPVGLSVISALKARGVGPVIATDFSAGRRAVAEILGADLVLDPAQESPQDSWESLNVPATLSSYRAARATGQGMRQAVIFDCVGLPGMLQKLFETSPPASTIMVVGVCMEPDVIEPSLAIHKQIDVRFVIGYTPDEFAGTLRAIAEGERDVTPLMTGIVGLSDVPGTFDALANADRQIKVLVDPRK